MVLALFSPEIVLSIALSEWRAASRVLDAAQVAGAVVYAEAEVARIEKAMLDTRHSDKLQQALDNTRAAAGDAKVATTTARTKAADARKQAADARKMAAEAVRNNDPISAIARKSKRILAADMAFADLSAKDFHRCWRKPQTLQRDALKSVRELRLVFREYQAECSRPGIRKWWDQGVNTLRRSPATKWMFAQDAIDHDIGRESAYFSVMGGYTFCPLKEEHNPDHEFTLTPEALAFLLREGFITTASLAKLRKVVVDKGKSDMIAKLLVCVQGLWMAVNCVTRKIAGLPLTLLELNVVMHVLCAVAVYACWWKKPHDAGLPISLSLFSLRPESWALIYTMDKFGPKLSCSVEGPPPVEKHTSQDPTSDSPNEIVSLSANQPGSAPSVEPAEKTAIPDNMTADNVAADVKGNTYTHEETATPGDEAAEAKDIHTDTQRGFTLSFPTPTPREVKREKRRDRDISAAAAKEFRDRNRKRVLDISAATAKEIRLLNEGSSPLVSLGEGPYPLSLSSVTMTSDSLNIKTGKNLYLVLVPLCLIYGGVHASAWNRHFPTATERLLWRISCIIVGFPGPGAGAVRFFEFVFSKREDIRDRIKDRTAAVGKQIGKTMLWLFALTVAVAAAGGSIYGIFLVLSHRPMTKKRIKIIIALSIETTIVVLALCACVLVALTGLLDSLKSKRVLLVLAVPAIAVYCAARAFIVIESFISMRSLPLGAYKTVRWENAWPHL